MPVYKFVQDSLQVSALGLSPSVPLLFTPGTTHFPAVSHTASGCHRDLLREVVGGEV